MAHSYGSAYPPGININPSIKTFFENFYKLSDIESAHSEYCDQYTSSATLIMASKTAKGPEQILALRKSMWEKVESRLHQPIKIFPFGKNEYGTLYNEFMLYGIVDYVLRDGRKAGVEWAARACLEEEEEEGKGEWKMAFYQVYLDTNAMQNAK